MQPRKSARQARSAATVGVIVEAAARILETVGLAGFTTNAIAERAGVSVGSLYQYFPNKDAITRALIRRELEVLEAAVTAIDVAQTVPTPLACFIAVAVGQQLHRPALAQLLEVEEDRLGALGDVDPVRERVTVVLSAILASLGHGAGRDVVQDVMALIGTLVNAAASRGERDAARLMLRIEAVVGARLSAA
jgi:AcrR family transcriptional regulator